MVYLSLTMRHIDWYEWWRMGGAVHIVIDQFVFFMYDVTQTRTAIRLVPCALYFIVYGRGLRTVYRL